MTDWHDYYSEIATRCGDCDEEICHGCQGCNCPDNPCCTDNAW